MESGVRFREKGIKSEVGFGEKGIESEVQVEEKGMESELLRNIGIKASFLNAKTMFLTPGGNRQPYLPD